MLKAYIFSDSFGLIEFTNNIFAFHQLRALYSMYLRKTKSLNKLLYHLFRLMPENPSYGEASLEISNKDPKTFFTEELQLSIRGRFVSFSANYV